MFIASKYEEIYPIKLSVVYEKIGHRKLSKDEIKAKEADIVYNNDSIFFLGLQLILTLLKSPSTK